MVRIQLSNRQPLFLLWLLALSLGCGSSGPNRLRVFGDVSYEGKPVTKGEIQFHPLPGTQGPLSGGLITDGHYDVPAAQGPLAGNYRVVILAYRKTGRKIPNMAGELIDHEDNFLPEKYSGVYSELSAQMVAGEENEHHFHLEKPSS